MEQTILALPTPLRALATDDPAEILSFASEILSGGGEVALATLTGISGGAARSLGSQVVVSADGRFCGYVSGGCVEAAVASESLAAMACGSDRVVSYGEGSPFFDVVLPCGGGITISIHILRDGRPINDILDGMRVRRTSALQYSPDSQLASCEPPARSGWHGQDFVTVYRPRTRVVISGENFEAQAVASLAKASGYDVVMGHAVQSPGNVIDEFTAVIMLHHDLDAEEKILDLALESSAFYIGALGSTRTHAQRTARLQERGWPKSLIDRIKAPIGFFGPTRDARSLALSVLADVAASRLALYG